MPDHELSLRHRILKQMVDTYRAVQPPAAGAVPTPQDWPLSFSVVELGPLSDPDHRKRYTLGIVPQPEQFKDKFPTIERFLQVGIEFRVTVNRDDNKPGDMIERLLTVVENVVLRNRQWNGLAIDTTLLNSDIDLSTYNDKSASGVLFVQVHYRHGTDDNRNIDPTVY